MLPTAKASAATGKAKVSAFHQPSLLDYCIAEPDMLNIHELWWNPGVKTDHAAVVVTFAMRRPPRPPPKMRAWRPTSEAKCKEWMRHQKVTWTVAGIMAFAARTHKAFQTPGSRRSRRANRDSVNVKDLIQARRECHDDSDYFMFGQRIQEQRQAVAKDQAGEMEQLSWKKGKPMFRTKKLKPITVMLVPPNTRERLEVPAESPGGAPPKTRERLEGADRHGEVTSGTASTHHTGGPPNTRARLVPP